MQRVICHSCRAAVEVEGNVGRQQTCSECSAYLRCCLNCRFYDASAYNECREPQADRIVDKEQGNFCDYFEAAAEHPREPTEAEAAKQALERLFKK